MEERHRFVLQHFMSHGILNAKEVKHIFAQCNERYKSGENIEIDIHTIKEKIAPFNLDIKKGISEEDGSSYYCLVNTVETPISRMSSIYQPNELEFFKKLIDLIVETEDGKVGSLQAVMLSENLPKPLKMGKEEAECLLNRLEKDKWITEGKDGKVSLAVRSLVELKQYLQEVYEDSVKLCYICNNICLYGETCTNCGIKIHLHCGKKLFAKQGAEKRCPCSDCRCLWGQININSSQG